MTTVISSSRSIDSVLLWYVHQGYNVDVVTLTAHTGGIAAGTSLMGALAFYASSTWKNVIAADTITAGSTVLGIILRNELVLATVNAASTITKVPMLVRGPALVHDDGIQYTAHTKSLCQAVLLERGIKVVDETGAAYSAAQ